METLYFFIRHTPFWSMPLIFISVEFAYVFWIRKKKKLLGFCFSVFIVSLAFLLYYIYAGGPENSVRLTIKLYLYYFS